MFFSGFAGLLLVVSLFLQLGLHFTPVHAGLTFIPMSLGVAITRGCVLRADAALRAQGAAGRPADRLRRARLAGDHGDHDGVGVSTWELVPALLAFGLGMGFVFGPLFNVILAGVEEHEVGSASGTLNAVQQLGNSIGVAVLATIFFSLLDHGHTSPAALTRTVLISAAVFVVAFGAVLPAPQGRADGGVLAAARCTST